MSVRIKGYEARESEARGTYVVLLLESDELELVQSHTSGAYYARAARCTIFSTLDEEGARRAVGKVFPGTIVREKCEPFEWAAPSTGEVLTLDHRYRYLPFEETLPAEFDLQVA